MIEYGSYRGVFIGCTCEHGARLTGDLSMYGCRRMWCLQGAVCPSATLIVVLGLEVACVLHVTCSLDEDFEGFHPRAR
jgi:hypothetical protein